MSNKVEGLLLASLLGVRGVGLCEGPCKGITMAAVCPSILCQAIGLYPLGYVPNGDRVREALDDKKSVGLLFASQSYPAISL